MSHCVTFHQNISLSLLTIGRPFYMLLDFCFWFLISVLLHGGFKFKLPWTEKSTVFPENSEHDYLALQLLFPQKPSSSLSRTHWSEAYPLCKNGMTNPFNRDTEGPPKNVLFTTLQLNRKCTAFPQDSENGFPMSGGMQSGACVFLAVISAVSHVSQAKEINRGASGRSQTPINHSHPFHAYHGATAGKVLKMVLNVVVAELTEATGELLFWQWLTPAFVMGLKVTDGGMHQPQKMSNTVIT